MARVGVELLLHPRRQLVLPALAASYRERRFFQRLGLGQGRHAIDREKDQGGQHVRVVPRRVLIEMKKSAGRPRDLEDIEALEQLDPRSDR